MSKLILVPGKDVRYLKDLIIRYQAAISKERQIYYWNKLEEYVFKTDNNI